MSGEREDFLSNLYGKSLIVYGTGNVGKAVIPYLARNPNIDLCGVTNSRTVEDNVGGFLDTGLPFCSLRRWAEILPNASILIVAQRGYDDIYAACRDAGFQEILFAPTEMIMAGMTAAQDIAEARLMGDLNSLCLANEIHDTHTVSFSEFKGCHRGQDVVVLGCGPTLNYYNPINGLPHVGTNSSFLFKNIKLDYYFLLHYTPEWCEELKSRDFVKFFMVNRNDNSDDKFPEYVIEENHARRFFNIHYPAGYSQILNIILWQDFALLYSQPSNSRFTQDRSGYCWWGATARKTGILTDGDKIDSRGMWRSRCGSRGIRK